MTYGDPGRGLHSWSLDEEASQPFFRQAVEMNFPVGAVQLTGTGLVPERDFTLQADDLVVIDVPGVGTLTNPVVRVGR